jgi:hypothetical protein
VKVVLVKEIKMENKVKLINEQNGKVEIEFNSDNDIFVYFDKFLAFLRASTFSDLVILRGIIHSLYEILEEAEFNKNESLINEIKEMLNEINYLKGK